MSYTAPAIAIIGTREPTRQEAILAERFGKLVAERGLTLRTGRAIGVDARAIRGAQSIHQANVELYVPWTSYNAQEVAVGAEPFWSTDKAHKKPLERLTFITEEQYPHWGVASEGTRALQIRNTAIVMGPDARSPVAAVLALPKEVETAGQLGGTGYGMKLAMFYQIPLFDLRYESAVKNARELITSL